MSNAERFPSYLELRNQSRLERPTMPDEYHIAVASLAQCAYEEQSEGTFVIPPSISSIRDIARVYLT